MIWKCRMRCTTGMYHLTAEQRMLHFFLCWLSMEIKQMALSLSVLPSGIHLELHSCPDRKHRLRFWLAKKLFSLHLTRKTFFPSMMKGSACALPSATCSSPFLSPCYQVLITFPSASHRWHVCTLGSVQGTLMAKLFQFIQDLLLFRAHLRD